MTFPRLFQEMDFGFLRLANRIVMGSMHTGLEEASKGAERMAAFYAARAGAGLIITGGVAPNAEGRVSEGAATLENDEHVAHHAEVTAAVHAAGGRIALQILHTGRYAYHRKCVAPSALQAPINQMKPRELSHDEVERTIDDFANCAALARKAGYDGVEVMGSEGYLINQFIAPRTNVRTDSWGGSFENRIRFPLEILRRVKKAAGDDFLIVFRLSCLDLVEEGSTWEEVVALAKEVQKAGAHIINTGIGWHEARVPTIAAVVPHGAYAWVTAKLKQEVSIPLVAVNRINTAEVAESILARGDADFVSMARPLLADPKLPEKAKRGDVGAINTCIACNQACLDHIFEMKVASCLVNPFACHETERIVTPVAGSARKKIAVVGAGPAGLAAATTAAARGHAVTLFEAESRVGGQFQLACVIPGKEDYAETVRYFENELVRTGVTVKLGARVGVKDLAGFDGVILASGVTPRIPKIAGSDLPHVVNYHELLAGTKRAGATVAVIGAGGIGFDVSEYLTHPEGETSDAYYDHWGVDLAYASRGGVKRPSPWKSARRVYLLQRKPGKPGETLGKTTGWVHKASLKARGVEMLSGVTYERIVPAGIEITYRDETKVLAVDTIVLCAGQESELSLKAPLEAAGIPVTLVGGALFAGELDAKRAILEGTKAAADM